MRLTSNRSREGNRLENTIEASEGECAQHVERLLWFGDTPWIDGGRRLTTTDVFSIHGVQLSWQVPSEYAATRRNVQEIMRNREVAPRKKCHPFVAVDTVRIPEQEGEKRSSWMDAIRAECVRDTRLSFQLLGVLDQQMICYLLQIEKTVIIRALRRSIFETIKIHNIALDPAEWEPAGHHARLDEQEHGVIHLGDDVTFQRDGEENQVWKLATVGRFSRFGCRSEKAAA